MFVCPQFVPPSLEQLTQEIDEVTVLVKREAQLNKEVRRRRQLRRLAALAVCPLFTRAQAAGVPTTGMVGLAVRTLNPLAGAPIPNAATLHRAHPVRPCSPALQLDEVQKHNKDVVPMGVVRVPQDVEEEEEGGALVLEAACRASRRRTLCAPWVMCAAAHAAEMAAMCYQTHTISIECALF